MYSNPKKFYCVALYHSIPGLSRKDTANRKIRGEQVEFRLRTSLCFPLLSYPRYCTSSEQSSLRDSFLQVSLIFRSPPRLLRGPVSENVERTRLGKIEIFHSQEARHYKGQPNFLKRIFSNFFSTNRDNRWQFELIEHETPGIEGKFAA